MIERRRRVQTFAATAGPYDERPVLSEGVDPQLYLSRNDRPQPFFLICEKDTVLIQMTGHARVELRDTNVLYFDTSPGDFIYIPARTPSRITPWEVSIMYRFKAAAAGLEATSWYCDACGQELYRHVWTTMETVSQRGYLEAVEAFNASSEKRSCQQCGHQHSAIDTAPYQWSEIAGELEATDEAEAW